MTIGAKMNGGNPDPEFGRDPDELYETPPDVTQALLDVYFHLVKDMLTWEPCAASGMMVDVLRNAGIMTLASDVKPLRGDVFRFDAMEAHRMPLSSRRKIRAIITNPPFNDAERFIMKFTDTDVFPGLHFTALLLPATYWHASTRDGPVFRTRRPHVVHPLLWRPDFKGRGRPTMNVIWTVWRFPAGNQTYYNPMSRPVVPK